MTNHSTINFTPPPIRIYLCHLRTCSEIRRSSASICGSSNSPPPATQLRAISLPKKSPNNWVSSNTADKKSRQRS